MRLLVIEPEPLVAQALLLLLDSVAYEVCLAKDEAALAAAPGAYDLIVVANGAGATGWCDRLFQTPVLLLTDQPGPKPPWATATLVKPVEAVALVTLVSDLVGQPLGQVSPVAQLSQSEARFRTMADHAPVMVWISDATGHCSYLSQSWYEFTGQTEATGLGLGWLMAVHPEDRPQAKAVFLKATAAQGEFRIEYRLRRRDGEYRWMLDAARPWLGESGQFEGYIGSVLDIDERVQGEADRRHLEQSLKASEAKLSGILNSAIAAISSFRVYRGGDWEYEYWSAGCEQLFGYPRSAYADRHFWLEQVHPEDREQVIMPLFETFYAGGQATAEYRFRHRDGSLRWFHSDYASQPIAADCWVVTSLNYDITDRKVLERDRERFLAVGSDLQVITDRNGHFHWVSPTFEQTLGWTVAEMTAIPWADFVHPDDLAASADEIAELFQGRDTFAFENRYRHRDGSYRWLLWKARLYPDDDRVYGGAIDITERKRSEAALRESEEKYRLLFNSMDEGFCVIEMLFDEGDRPIDYRFLDINPTFAQQTGLVNAQGKRARKLVPNLEAHWFEILGEVALTGESVRFEDHAEAMHRWFDVFAFRFGAPDLRQVAVLFRDVTERRQTDLALKQSERKLRAVFDSTFEFIGLLKTDGTVLDINHTALTVIAATPAEVIGQPFWLTPWWEHFPEQRERVRQAIAQAAQGETVRMENQHIWADGSTAWVDFSIKPVLDERGRVVMLVPEGRDITERKQAETKIREQAALLDIASDAITVRDFDQHILYWNRGAERLYGFTAAEALGHRAFDLLRCETARHGDMLPTLLDRGQWQGELEKLTKANQAVTVAARWTLVRDKADQPRFILSVETDITEKKALEAQFYQAQRLESLGRLASGIAHDLNNVFTPIVTISQLLRLTQHHLSDRAQDQLRLLEESAKRGASMVQQILSITRSSGGSPSEVDLGPLLQDAAHMLEQSLPPDVVLHLEPLGSTEILARSPLRVCADPTHLHQVMMNLGINARDAMPDGGTLTIAAEPVFVDAAMAGARLDAQAGEYVRLTVADTGTGIDPGVRDRIFDPFFTTKPPGQGTGLGLATVLGIVKASGGFIDIESVLGRGTQVQVYLPALVGSSGKDSGQIPGDAPQQGKGDRILLVEDDASVQDAVRSLLTSYNYSVLVANNGLEALDGFVHRQPDLVVLDIMMPGMDGITLVRHLKAAQPEIKVVATSGLPTYREPAIAAGASAFLLKPYNLSDLLTTLSTLLP